MSRVRASVPLRLWIHRIVCGVVWVLATIAGWLGSWSRAKRHDRPMICIEAGRRGWDLIEYQEVWRSAIEFFGADAVIKHEIVDRRRYVSECRAVVRATRPQLYWVDPRSGAQEPVRALFQSLAVALILAWYGVKPIAWLADGPNRVWRLQAEMVTAKAGTCLVFMHPRLGGIRFAHRRVHGPCIFPLSLATLRRLQAKRSQGRIGNNPVVSFVGSLYEPRRSWMLALRDLLASRDVNLRLVAPELTGRRLTNDEYWDILLQSDILVMTAEHVESDGHDPVREPHFVFRYTEALAAGAALIAPVVHGTEKLIRPGRDYVGLESFSAAAEEVERLCSDGERINLVSQHGHRTMAKLVEHQWFWCTVTQVLTVRSVPWWDSAASDACGPVFCPPNEGAQPNDH